MTSESQGELDSAASESQGSQPRQPVLWASSLFGWEDTLEMDDSGGGSARPGGERFDGRVNGLSVTDLKLGFQNRLQLLRSRRSATAATLNDEDKFAVVLDLCSGDAYHVLQDRFRERLEANALDREKIEVKNREVEESLACSPVVRTFQSMGGAVVALCLRLCNW